MPFIGNQPALSYTSFAKQDFTTSATTSYTLDHPVANANELALFINFVRQEPTTAYTASGTTLTLTSATSATDDMYCVFLGKAVQTVNPPSGSVGTSQLVDSSVTSAKMFSGFKNGIDVIDQWRITSNISLTGSVGVDITTNWERVDTCSPALLGTGMTESSGIFTFPQTGLWELDFQFTYNNTTGDTRYIFTTVLLATDGVNFNVAPLVITPHVARSEGDSTITVAYGSYILDVTNASNFKIKINANPSSNILLNGDTSSTRSGIIFKRIGDT